MPQNKIKIGILNFQDSTHNYGAVLQAAALNNYISNNFNSYAEHINYVFGHKPSSFKVAYAKFKNLLMYLGLKKPRIINSTIANQETFEKFRQEWLPRSTVTYSSYDDLINGSLNYTHVIVGSDQVWRPKYAGKEPLVFFLNFVDHTTKKISYAASFGQDEWEQTVDETQVYINEINKFNFISVREKSGINICSEVFDVESTQVLDPTLLIGKEYFENIIDLGSNAIPSSIIYYKLSLDSAFNHLINSVENSLSCKSKNIYMEGNILRHRYIDVSDWLNYIKSSKIVITDSFHCVCFALLFEKPIIYYPNIGRGMTRVEGLFDLLDLKSCIFQEESDIDQIIKIAMNINYSKVNKLIEGLRLESHNFLAESLTSN